MTHAWSNHIPSHFLIQEGGDRVGVVNPTVRVKNFFIYLRGGEAVNRIAKVLLLCQQETTGHQDEHGGLVVEFEGVAVDVDGVYLEQVFDA